MGCTSSRVEFPNEIHPNIFSASMVLQSGKGIRGKLEVTATDLILHRKRTEPVIWPLQFLRRFGFQHDLFSFESGRRCESGEGIFTFRCPRAQELCQLVQASVQDVGNEYRNRASNGHTPRRSTSRMDSTSLHPVAASSRSNGDAARRGHSPSPYQPDTFRIPQDNILLSHTQGSATMSASPATTSIRSEMTTERSTNFSRHLGAGDITPGDLTPSLSTSGRPPPYKRPSSQTHQNDVSSLQMHHFASSQYASNKSPNISNHSAYVTSAAVAAHNDSVLSPCETTAGTSSSDYLLRSITQQVDAMSASINSNEVFSDNPNDPHILVHPYINVTPGMIPAIVKSPYRRRPCASDSSAISSSADLLNGNNPFGIRAPPPIPPRSRNTKVMLHQNHQNAAASLSTNLYQGYTAPRRTWSQPGTDSLHHSYVNLVEGLPPPMIVRRGPLEYVTVNLAAPGTSDSVRRSSTSSMSKNGQQTRHQQARADSLRNYAQIDCQMTKALQSSANTLRSEKESLSRKRHGSTVSQHSSGPSFAYV